MAPIKTAPAPPMTWVAAALAALELALLGRDEQTDISMLVGIAYHDG